MLIIEEFVDREDWETLEPSVFSLQFFCELKVALKKDIC